MEKFEYTITNGVVINIDHLNEMGKQGWKLVQIIGDVPVTYVWIKKINGEPIE